MFLRSIGNYRPPSFGGVLFLLLLIRLLSTTNLVQSTYVNSAKYEKLQHTIRPIRVALSVDDHSKKDLIVLMNSVVETALEPDSLVFHIVAVGKDRADSEQLRDLLASSLNNCLPSVAVELIAFFLPPESGFSAQLASSKKKSHWNSQSGADMARFFLASLFPHVERLLYLDNDIIVSCCLEEVWDTDLGGGSSSTSSSNSNSQSGKVVGIVLDDLKWATQTQFKYHYNASHPLVMKNMRRGKSQQEIATAFSAHLAAFPADKEIGDFLSKEDFSKCLPRYPNDGVLLIDVKRYNEYKVLESLEEIATANGGGDWVVNLGTQQFTVLTLWDRWVELTPRANLRHFPDMARGYMMWFYYNGFIHYAGQAKPRALCTQGNYKDNFLRVGSYTPWATSNRQISLKCKQKEPVMVSDSCVSHIPVASSLPAFFSLLRKIALANRDDANLYIRAGAIHGDMTSDKYKTFNEPLMQLVEAHANASVTAAAAAAAGATTDTEATFYKYFLADKSDVVEAIDRHILYSSDWSFRNFLGISNNAIVPSGNAQAAGAGLEQQIIESLAIIKAATDSMQVDPSVLQQHLQAMKNFKPLKGGYIPVHRPPEQPKGQEKFGKRNFLVVKKTLCDSLYIRLPSKSGMAAAVAQNSSSSSRSKSGSGSSSSGSGSGSGSLRQRWVTTAGRGSVVLDSLGNAATADSNSNSGVTNSNSGGRIGEEQQEQQQCASLLSEVREEKKKHWDVIMVMIDILPPAVLKQYNDQLKQQQRASTASATATASAGGSSSSSSQLLFAKTEPFSRAEAAAISHAMKTAGVSSAGGSASGSSSSSSSNHNKLFYNEKSRAFGTLLNLDLSVMRPRVVFVRLYNYRGRGGRDGGGIEEEVRGATKFLTRHGFTVARESHGLCGDELKEGDTGERKEGSSSSSSSSRSSSKAADSAAATASGGHEELELVYACLWGTRLNHFEIIDIA